MRTLTDVRIALDETFRKWNQCGTDGYTLTFQVNNRALNTYQWGEKAKATVTFTWKFTAITISMKKHDKPIENAIALAKAIEMLRMAEYRGVDLILYGILQFRYKSPTPPPPRPEPRINQHPHYAALHIANDAPLAVAEAAYKTLAKLYHPDVGGNAEKMKAINAAIAFIRDIHQ